MTADMTTGATTDGNTPERGVSALPSTLLDAIARFVRTEPDTDMNHELLALQNRAQTGDLAAKAELDDRFAGTLSFGTAGLRGAVAGGTNRMNRTNVRRASAGFAQALLDFGPRENFDAKKQGILVGFDGRYTSRQFAEDAAAVFAMMQIPAYVFDTYVPTPLVAFGMKYLGCAGAVVVTASHNPPQDNGFKVFWADAAQIVPPYDSLIAERIQHVEDAQIAQLPPAVAARQQGLRRVVPNSLFDAYRVRIQQTSLHPNIGHEDAASANPLKIAYTAMHGVGYQHVLAALRDAGFQYIDAVPSQCDPDGAFRTVAFPNPEEKGALDRALAFAAANDANLLLANDPDADRLAAAVKRHDGTWQTLTGNEVGALLADDAIRFGAQKHIPAVVATSLVSSTLLSRMAKNLGVQYRETLTGFKWLAVAALDARKQGHRFLFGYEEALGYCVDGIVLDKDGVSTAVRLVEMAAYLRKHNKSLLDRLDEIMVEHGLSHGIQWSMTFRGHGAQEKMQAAMSSLRSNPPTHFAEDAVATVVDLQNPTSSDVLPVGGQADVLIYHLQSGARLIVRPSGTEPKVKFYLELVGKAETVDAIKNERARLDGRGRAIQSAVQARLGA